AWISTLQNGLTFVGFDKERLERNNIKRKVDWFKAFYGVEPTTVEPFLADLKEEYPDTNFKDSLMTLNWLYLYDTYPVLSARWKQCEEYIGSKVIDYGNKMAHIARMKIHFEIAHNIENGRSLDTASFQAREMRKTPHSEWYDWKSHSCGLFYSKHNQLQKYEFCLAIYEPRIVWISGPHKPSKHDITIFRGGDVKQDKEDWDQDALFFQLKEGDKCIGDIVTEKNEHSPEFKTFLSRVKNRQETFHWRLKAFNILGGRFRHGTNTEERMRLHGMAVEAVAGIVQYDYDNGHPPFDV
ncbi:hypothetical protein ACHAWF_009526, partial [Thalassiosira exigua]